MSERGDNDIPNLRNREELRPPSGLYNSLQSEQPRMIAHLKRKRSGKKGAITRRINEVTNIIQAKGSRTKLEFLRNGIQELWQETLKLHEELMVLVEETSEDFSDEWIEEVGTNVNTCYADIHEYLISRATDPPSVYSDESNAGSIKEYLDGIPEQNTDIIKWAKGDKSGYDLAHEMSKLNINKEDAKVTQTVDPPETNISRDLYHVYTQPVSTEIYPPPIRNVYKEIYPPLISNQEHFSVKTKPISGSTIPGQTRMSINTLYSYPGVDHAQVTSSAKPRCSESAANKEPTNAIGEAVDSWIDRLDPLKPSHNQIRSTFRHDDLPMQLLAQQRLPPITITTFDGAAEHWIDFIVQFYENVHSQPYLTDVQRKSYLAQYLKGEPKRAIQGYGNDRYGYYGALKKLKYMFGQRVAVAQAILNKVTKGKMIASNDIDGLNRFYYVISDCLHTLQRMQYHSDLYSSDVLRQAVQRLPPRLIEKWSEHCFRIRQSEEPTLIHFEKWLQNKIMAMKDPCMQNLHKERCSERNPVKGKREITKLSLLAKVNQNKKAEKHKGSSSEVGTNENQSPTVNSNCIVCKGNHRIFKCNEFLKKNCKDRLTFVRNKKLCFNCLGSHQVKNCPSKRHCFEENCNKPHHTLLHHAFIKNDQKKGDNDQKKNDNDQNDKGKDSLSPVVTSGHVKVGRHVYLQVVPVRIHGKNGKFLKTYALLDGGSQTTIIRRDIAEILEIPGKLKTINLAGIKDDGEKIEAKKLSFQISSIDNETKLNVTDALAIGKAKFKMPSHELPENFHTSKDWEYLKGLGIANVEADEITVLIGADLPPALLATEVKIGKQGQPYATKTPFGWALIGVLEQPSTNIEISRSYQIRIDNDQKLHKQVEQFWETETFGTKFNYKGSLSIQDQRALEILDSETKLENGHYIVPMLWEDKNAILSNNYGVAYQRLQFLIRKFKKDEKLLEMYSRNINEYIEKGYARKMSSEEVSKASDITWYLPHHGVFQPHKPGKVRTVFDAASKFKGKSLNDCLITGPDLTNNLVGILLRFRNKKIAVVADIEAMYNQVKLNKHDMDAMRFLWRSNIEDNGVPEVLQMTVHIMGAKDSPCCATFALQKTARDNRHQYSEITVQSVLKSFYMDDFIHSVDNEEEASKLALELVEMLKKGGFRLTKFNSNSINVLKSLPGLTVKSLADLEFEEDNIGRALGIKWNVTTDSFTFSTVTKSLTPTKRHILSITSSIFDPLGLLVPFVVSAKILLQELWRMKYNWDETIDVKLQNTWNNWIDQLQTLPNILIPRYYHNNIDTKTMVAELHTFCDASESAFAAASYIRTIDKDGKIDCNLIMAKSRLAPLKVMTIPRLELQGAVLAARLVTFLKDEIEVEFVSTTFWTDSMTTLQYINNEAKRFKSFIANRVSEIRESSQVDQWRHVEGVSNPADLGTRGIQLTELKPDSIWFKGPQFLYEELNKKPIKIAPLDENNKEIKQNIFVNNTKVKESNVVNFEKYSSWYKILSIIGWIKRFINNARLKPESRIIKNSINHDEYRDAENTLWILVQHESFADEIENLKKGLPLSKNNNLFKLEPFLDHEGIIRVGGRLKESKLQIGVKQVILPPNKHISDLLIRTLHERYAHCGLEFLLAKIREKYWIIKGRTNVKRVLHKCFFCAKRRAKPKPPFMGELPTPRLAINTPPYFNTGVDYFGPITVKILRSRAKRWGCLFTCMTTRAVHIEVAESLDTDCFINCLERFVSRRGHPNLILSDCGTNFKGAERELKEELVKLNHSKIETHAVRKGFTWKFNPPEAPHMGGAWERMVQSVKRSLKAILKDQVVNDFTLATVLCEVESLVNSRPITHVSDDINDLEALTPNHFLLGRSSSNLSFKLPDDHDLNHRKRWRRAQALTNSFWKRWLKEYLPTIATRPKWMDVVQNLQIGSLVLISDSNSARGNWPLARVVAVHPGNDGVVRVVDVKTKDGVYRRPVAKLCRIDY